MPKEQKYNIVYAGKLAKGFSLEDVKSEFVSQMKIPASKVEQLFNGQRVIFKRSLNRKKAKLLQQKLLKIGAEVVIVPSAPSASTDKPAQPFVFSESSGSTTPAVGSVQTEPPSQAEYDEEMNARILRAKAMIASQQLEQQMTQSQEPNPIRKLLVFTGILGLVVLFLYYNLKSMA